MDKNLNKISSSYSKMNEAVEDFTKTADANEAPLADINKWLVKIKDEAQKLGLEFFILAQDGEVGATNAITYVGKKGIDPVKDVIKFFKAWKKQNAFDIEDEEQQEQEQSQQQETK